MPITCYVPNVLSPLSCCAPVYEPTRTDDVRACLYNAIGTIRRTAVDDWSALEEFGNGHEAAFRKAVDLNIVQEFLMDIWAQILSGTSVAKVWENNKLASLHRFFKCRYGIDLTNAFATVGVYNPDRPPPGTSIPTV